MCLCQAFAREMVIPVGVGSYGVGFDVSKEGEGWYFAHGGSSWGFQCDLIAHCIKGYGAVIMTNVDAGGALIQQLRRIIQREYRWDVLDGPIPRVSERQRKTDHLRGEHVEFFARVEHVDGFGERLLKATP
jgi:hypothetical protein